MARLVKNTKTNAVAVRDAKDIDGIPASAQLDLFSNFWGGTDDLSNTIELWDALPKYAYTPRRQNKVRDEKGRLEVHSHEFVYRKRRCRIEIQPARIKENDGSFADYYPSADEELVEEILRKIFADQQFGRHDVREAESWVKFSLQMIRKELKKRKKTRSIQEIKRSIDILSKTHISLYVEDDKKATYMNPILNDVTCVTRDEYLTDGSVMCLARFPALISKCVNELSYRQFNYGKLMKMESQLARWLHKRLSHNYTNAHLLYPYEILFSAIQRDSDLLTHPRKSANAKNLERALNELKGHAVLFSWNKTERRGSKNKIDDILYSLIPDSTFVSEVKTANARQRDSVKRLQQRQ